jgi:hypothetical protein
VFGELATAHPKREEAPVFSLHRSEHPETRAGTIP